MATWYCSVAKSCPNLWLRGLQHTRFPSPLLSSGICSDSCSLNWWCYLTISSSATLFSFCLQSFPASGSFPMSRLFASSDQNIGALASVLPMNIQGWFPLGLTGLISLQSTGHWRAFSSTMVWRHQLFDAQPLYGPTLQSYGLQHARSPVLHYFPEFTQTHIHWVCDAI